MLFASMRARPPPCARFKSSLIAFAAFRPMFPRAAHFFPLSLSLRWCGEEEVQRRKYNLSARADGELDPLAKL